jgi:creatinine amidohydrolase
MVKVGYIMSQKLIELNWMEIEKLDKEKTVIVSGVAPIEEHGIHLPMGVDVYETEHWITLGIEKLEKVFPQHTFLTMPSIP